MDWREWLVRMPLRNLYANGPRGLGFWGGATNDTLCAIFNPSTDAGFWTQSTLTAEQCAAQVARDADSFMVFAETVVYVFVCYEFMRAGVALTTYSLAAIPRTMYQGCKNMAGWWQGAEDVGVSARVQPSERGTLQSSGPTHKASI